MRYRFFRPDEERETQEYLGTVRRMDEFWGEFTYAAGRWSDRGVGHWVAHLRAALAKVHPGLGLEVRDEVFDNKCLFILPTEDVALLPMVELMVERAPEVPPWTVETQREPQSLERSLQVTLRDCGVDLQTSRARVGVGRGHALDVVIASEHFASSRDERGLDAALSLLGSLLGDDVFEHWVQEVNITPQARANPLRLVGEQSGWLPLALQELADSVEAAVRGIRGGLPEHPCHVDCERAEWAMFELGQDGEPSEQVQHPDIFVATSMRPEMLRCHLSGSHFHSPRFSAHGEVFCGLRYTPTEAEMNARADRRIEVEMQLDRALVPGRLGCVVGSGMGTRYVYVYLALQQLEPALQLAGRRLRDLDLPKDARFFFLDSAWRHEWLGVWGAEAAPG